jgi:hypothetical protein
MLGFSFLKAGDMRRHLLPARRYQARRFSATASANPLKEMERRP